MESNFSNRRCTVGPFCREPSAAASASEVPNNNSYNSSSSAADSEYASPSIGCSASVEPPAFGCTDTLKPPGAALGETQRLLLWSASPSLLEAKGTSNCSAETAEGEAGPTSPSAALLHSLGDEGLRSALQPPGLLPAADWLRYLLLQAIEDAQLLFSSLWDECACSAMGLPHDTSNSEHKIDEKKEYGDSNPPYTAAAANALDPLIAFAIAPEKSAPHRRLSRSPAPATAAEATITGEKEEVREGSAAEGAGVSRQARVKISTCTNTEAETGYDRDPNTKREEETETNQTANVIEEAAKSPKRSSPPTAREYISATMSWALKQLESPRLFPPSPTAAAEATAAAEDGAASPEKGARDQTEASGSRQDNDEEEELRATAALVVRRLLRCYAHIYLYHLPLLLQHDAVASANHCLKKLMFLAVDGGLVERGGPLQTLETAWLGPKQSDPQPRNTETPQAERDRDPNDPRITHASQAEAQWLLPALHKAEQCLGALETEELPSFGE
ncbi:hypothetical protein, conserved [Eimeria praecox]|uniref:Uncharacterized protein n=1 Tax=Eimeria praecox TaxID=51316 RepID=U6G547_9EIME|nr:hypothetical protein, conserved [Eimeria praecox]